MLELTIIAKRGGYQIIVVVWKALEFIYEITI